MGGEEGAKVLVWPGQSSDEPTGPNLTHPTPDLCSQASLQGLSRRGGGRQGGPQMAARPAPGALLWESGWNRALETPFAQVTDAAVLCPRSSLLRALTFLERSPGLLSTVSCQPHQQLWAQM